MSQKSGKKIPNDSGKQNFSMQEGASQGQKEKTASGLSSKAEDQFELELCWCIQQLELTLSNGKLKERQLMDLSKSIRTLKSNSASLIRKRQIMRNTLGDYRQLMALDEKNLGKMISQIKFISAPKNNKSVFLKKSVSQTKQPPNNDNEPDQNDTKSDINEPFKFNFQIE
ncbi:UPF0488 protein CG14286 [Prorops nasuta]|uniref:UPF0488 protein CG14286 n=1 Tax=Prorops nasuta TaxID=863751 RepID=UPI0034CF4619